MKVELEFIDVNDRLPEESGYYLAKLPMYITTLYYDDEKRKWFADPFSSIACTESSVTHWAIIDGDWFPEPEEYSPEWFEKEMKRYKKEGTETGHREADRLMCELLRHLGYESGVCIFEEMEKWYS